MAAKEFSELYKSMRADSRDAARRKQKLNESRPGPQHAQTWHGKLVSRAQGATSRLLRSSSDDFENHPPQVGEAVDDWDGNDQVAAFTNESKFGEPTGETFSYADALSPTDGDQMRLLDILPGQSKDHVRCQLRTVGLKQSSPYHALSYTWGSEQHLVGIIVGDGKVLKVTPNLRSALRHLRRKEEIITLWVDAVCINQGDKDEKSWQVDLMKKFYRQSSKTYIWLGPAYDDLYIAFKTYSILARAEEAERRGITKDPAKDLEWDPEERDQALGCLKVEGASSWTTAASALMERPWFRRVWTCQEAVLSPSAELRCGLESYDWEDFQRAVNYANEKRLFTNHIFQEIFVDLDVNAAGVIPKRQDGDPNDPANLLLEYLIYYRRRQASLPADKVFSLLGFVDQVKEIGIQADYTATMAETFHKTTVQILKHTTHLDILGAVTVDPKNVLPLSWIADWRNQGAIVEPFHRHIPKENEKSKSASGLSKSSFRFEDNNTTMVLSGHLLGKIDAISQVLPARTAEELDRWDFLTETHLEDEDESWRTVRKEFGEASQAARMPIKWLAGTMATLMKWEKFAGVERRNSVSGRTYWQTLCAEQHLDNDEALTESEFYKWYDSLTDVRSLTHLPMGLGAKSPTVIFLAYMKSTWKVVSRFPEVMVLAIGRRLARVGGKLALVPPTAMMGDEVLLCKGGKVPLAARRVGAEWTMLGECYVHGGVMQGSSFSETLCQDLRFK